MIHDIITSLLALPALPASILALIALAERLSCGKGRHRKQR